MVYSNVSRAWRLTTSQRRFLLKIVGAGFFFLVLEATFKLQRILQQFLLTVVTPNLRGCYSDGDIVVEDLATSSLVSSSFIGYEVDSQTCQHLLQSYTHHRQLWEPCIPHQTIQTNRPIEQRLIFRGCLQNRNSKFFGSKTHSITKVHGTL